MQHPRKLSGVAVDVHCHPCALQIQNPTSKKGTLRIAEVMLPLSRSYNVSRRHNLEIVAVDPLGQLESGLGGWDSGTGDGNRVSSTSVKTLLVIR